ncbi:hypothetical protein E0500_042505 [Streptomyces sp. KM273126]|nr:hypothetical protein [Streptomyces sp. KM273126]
MGNRSAGPSRTRARSRGGDRRRRPRRGHQPVLRDRACGKRENATVVNAALEGWAAALVADALHALRSAGLSAPLFFARDDGGLVSAEYFRRYPVIATTPATACAARGAVGRVGVSRALVIDVGAGAVCSLAVVDGEPERSAVPGPGPLGVWMSLNAPAVHRPAPNATDLSTLTEAVARQHERLPDAPLLCTGGGARLPDALADASDTPEARATDGARFATASVCRVEFEQLASAVGRAEFEQRLNLARDPALSRAVAAGAAPDTVGFAFDAAQAFEVVDEGADDLLVLFGGAGEFAGTDAVGAQVGEDGVGAGPDVVEALLGEG